MQPDTKYYLAEDTIDCKDVNALIDWLKTNPRMTMGKLTVQFEKNGAINQVENTPAYVDWCNQARPHQSLNDKTPLEHLADFVRKVDTTLDQCTAAETLSTLFV